MATLIVLLVLASAVAARAMTAAERERFLRAVVHYARTVWQKAQRSFEETAPFRATLRARTRLAPVTAALAAINVTVFVLVLVGPGSAAAPDTLVAWGANFGPRTANGEWSRLFSAVFVHTSTLQLLVTIVSLVPLGFVVERLVGSVAFLGTYLAAGLFSSLFNLSVSPLAVTAGGSGAIAGVCGLLLAASMWGLLRRPRLTIPLPVLKWLAAPAVVLLAYTLATNTLAAAFVGFAVGFLAGTVLATRVHVRPTPVVRVAAFVVVAFFAGIATAVPLRGLQDASAVIQQVIATENRNVDAYNRAVQKFTAGQMTQEALARVIDRTILPELQSARERLDSLRKVPPQQQALAAAAGEYLALRDESWRIRSTALHRHSMKMLREADEKETASLVAFRRIG